eukprot:363474-Chlamydomonas_euryale.AAC.6
MIGESIINQPTPRPTALSGYRSQNRKQCTAVPCPRHREHWTVSYADLLALLKFLWRRAFKCFVGTSHVARPP